MEKVGRFECSVRGSRCGKASAIVLLRSADANVGVAEAPVLSKSQMKQSHLGRRKLHSADLM